MALNLEVPKIDFVIGQSIPNLQRKFIIMYKNNIPEEEMHKFLSYGKVVFFESFHQNIEDYKFDYYFINLQNPKAEIFIKCNDLQNYNIVYLIENNKENKLLSQKFQDNPYINVLKKLPDEQNNKHRWEKMLMYGANIATDIILPELKKPSFWAKLCGK
jgi:hypothetical protein